MIIFEKLRIKNFMSFGNIEQEFNLNSNSLSLILGENRDVSIDGTYSNSRNGAGKTTIIFALYYALYDNTIDKIKKENLVNKHNGKNMIVTLDFKVHDVPHRIIRGRKPNILKLFINDKEYDENQAQGNNRDTQSQINNIIGMSSELAKHILVMNTYVEPFLSQSAKIQRDLIEELLGFKELSEKSEVLKFLIKETNSQIKEEQFKINTLEDLNKKTIKQISELENKSNKWLRDNSNLISDLKETIDEMNKLDIDKELKNHKDIISKKEIENVLKNTNRDIRNKKNDLSSTKKSLDEINQHLKDSEGNVCHTCGQDVDKEKHKEITNSLNELKIEYESKINEIQNELTELENNKVELENKLKKFCDIKTFYDHEKDAWNHQSTIKNLEEQLNRELNSINPFTDQIENLKNETLQEISYEDINDLKVDAQHQEFLLKMLSNKDSFVRKRIIDQSIAYLNYRLDYYLEKIGLPHKVKFMNDLSVEITKLGHDYDFGNLSRGQRNRLSLSLSWAFRDVYENIKTPINFIFIDEMLDNGLDGAGLENALTILKDMSRNDKSVYLISHKEEFQPRVNNIINVVLENDFSYIETE